VTRWIEAHPVAAAIFVLIVIPIVSGAFN